MTTQQSPETTGITDLLSRFFGVPFQLQTYRNLTYLALAFPLGLLYFVGVVIGLSLGAGLFITWLGLPILVLTIAGATVLAAFEAELARRLVGTDVSIPEAIRGYDSRESVTSPEGGFLAALKRLLLAPTTWTSLLLVVLKFGFGLVAFVTLVTAGSVGFAMIGAPLFFDAPYTTYQFGLFTVDTLPEALVVSVGGILLTLSALHLLNALARLGGLLTAALLNVGQSSDGDETAAEV